MTKVITINVNGIRSAARKNVWGYLAQANPDFICIQELKAQEKDLTEQEKNPLKYHCLWHCAENKGYSGVAIYSREEPEKIQIGIGDKAFDKEGRYLQADFKKFSLVSLYLPSGSSSEERQQVKFRSMSLLFPLLKSLLQYPKPVLICGDWNIAHQNIDLKNWRSNQTHSGFLPEEREWLSQVFSLGWIDVWRTLYPETPGYTWWSHRGAAYQKDVGWRIDYHIASPHFADAIESASIYKEQKFSDHAPLVVNYQWGE